MTALAEKIRAWIDRGRSAHLVLVPGRYRTMAVHW